MTRSPRTSATPDVSTSRAPGRDAALAVAWVVFGGSVVALALAPIAAAGVIASTIGVGASLVAGTVIVRRTDVPRIGWLLVAAGASLNYITAARRYALAEPGSRFAEVGVAVLWSLPSLVMLAFLIFPTGRTPSRLGRWLVGLILLNALVEQALGVPAALGLLGGTETTDIHAVTDPVTSLTMLGIFVMHARVYSSRPRIEQLQIKWFMLSLLGIAAIPLATAMGPEGETIAIGIVASLPPMTIMIAITRYRLYDIDRVISRTLAYALVLATLAALFIGMVTLVTAVLPTQDRFAVAATTITVVALFNPLRRRVVDAVDRRFNRTRYVAQQVVEGFGRDVRDVTDLDEIGDRVHAVVSRTMAPATVAVWQPVSAGRGGTS